MQTDEKTLPELCAWADELPCAVTISDRDAKILYMNQKSKATFVPDGKSIIGHSLFEYHPAHAAEKIKHMLATGETNTYTIRKNGQRKIIYQTPWRKNGVISGMVEISIPIPDEIPHYER
jgi:transcriptional regulator with PAS, ATPase and Fis domain